MPATQLVLLLVPRVSIYDVAISASSGVPMVASCDILVTSVAMATLEK